VAADVLPLQADGEPADLAPSALLPDLPAAEPAAEPVVLPAAMPTAPPAAAPASKVAEPFVLDADALRAVAEEAGLHWVGSDAAKIRAAQEAMANETQPVRVPREPRPAVVADDGPLVLVETRKDLSQYKLPFETSAG
jgi:ribonuclease E